MDSNRKGSHNLTIGEVRDRVERAEFARREALARGGSRSLIRDLGKVYGMWFRELERMEREEQDAKK